MPNQPPAEQGHALPPAIQWVTIGTLTVYHVTEQELDQLEKGGPESTYFGFSIFLFSTGVSFLISLLTAKFDSERKFNIFLILALFGIIGGLLLIIVWLVSRRSNKRVARTIRARKPPEGEQQQAGNI